jgi:hypothetical protein
MIVTNLQIAPDRPGLAVISWTTANPEWYAWVFIDGTTTIGPLFGAAGETSRSVQVAWLTGESHVIEIQELPSLDLLAEPLTISPSTQPIITWTASEDAETYRLYWRDDPDGDDTLLYDGQVTADDRGICRLTCPTVLDGKGGKHHFFRVEAVDVYGNESTRASWTYWAAEPDDPGMITLAAGSAAGLYDISLTE